jgi:hypothetical protein
VAVAQATAEAAALAVKALQAVAVQLMRQGEAAVAVRLALMVARPIPAAQAVLVTHGLMGLPTPVVAEGAAYMEARVVLAKVRTAAGEMVTRVMALAATPVALKFVTLALNAQPVALTLL